MGSLPLRTPHRTGLVVFPHPALHAERSQFLSFEISAILSSLVFTSILTCLCVQKVFPCKIVLRVHALPIHGHYSLHRYYGRIRLPATLRIVLLCSSFDFSYHLFVEVQGLPSSCQFLVYTCHSLRPRGATLHSPYRIRLYCLRHIRKASTNPKRLRFVSLISYKPFFTVLGSLIT